MALNILVFVERRDGEVKRPSLEALGAARRIADARGGHVAAVALGPGAASDADTLARYGADRLFVTEAAHAERYSPELYAATVELAARESGASFIFMPGTSLGRDLVARTAARLRAACLTDLVEVDVDEGGVLRGKKPVYSGKAYARVAAPAQPALASLRPNVFAPTASDGRTSEVVPLAAPLEPQALKLTTVRVERAEEQELDVAEAPIVVAGGRGLKKPENFSLVRELAQALGGAVGASRAVVDVGWIAHANQVGQTGKVVSPNLYIACGISGAVQHLAGMSGSKVIVAINKDAEAPIFKVADFGVVGDLFEIVPAVTAAVRRLKAG